MRIFKLLLAVVLLLPLLSHAQDVYKYKDESGKWKFSNTPPPYPDQRERAAPLSQAGRDCTPFKVGEVRRLSSSAIPRSYPDIEVVSFELKLLDIGPGPRSAARFEWRLRIRNSAPHQEDFSTIINFLDCDGFPLGQERLPGTRLPTGQIVEVFGVTKVDGVMSHTVGVFNVAVRIPGRPPQDL